MADDRGNKAKRKRPAVEVEVDRSAKDLADGWIRGMGGANEADDKEEDEGKQAPRPARLGLGAKFVPHSKALTIDKEAEGRLSKKLKKLKKDNEEDSGTTAKPENEEDEEEESRTGAIKGKIAAKTLVPDISTVATHEKKKKNKKKKAQKQGDDEQGKGNATADTAKPSSEESKKSIPPKDKSKNAEEQGAGQPAGEGNEGEHSRGDGEWEERKPRRKRVKGKKTRSRQKNIRKDNRPAHLKPGYVPEGEAATE